MGEFDLEDGTDSAFRWSSEEGFVPLPPEFGTGTEAHDVSADGSVVVGWHEWFLPDVLDETQAAVWSGGGMTLLGWLPGSQQLLSLARAVSGDGSVIVGINDHVAFRWEDGVMVSIAFPGDAWGASGDGSVVVGRIGYESAFVWDPLHGTRILRDVLVDDYGLDLTGWSTATASPTWPTPAARKSPTRTSERRRLRATTAQTTTATASSTSSPPAAATRAALRPCRLARTRSARTASTMTTARASTSTAGLR